MGKITSEEIYDKACEYAKNRMKQPMLYNLEVVIQYAFEEGAQWMQNRLEDEGNIIIHAEHLTDEKRMELAERIAEFLKTKGE